MCSCRCAKVPLPQSIQIAVLPWRRRYPLHAPAGGAPNDPEHPNTVSSTTTPPRIRPPARGSAPRAPPQGCDPRPGEAPAEPPERLDVATRDESVRHRAVGCCGHPLERDELA